MIRIGVGQNTVLIPDGDVQEMHHRCAVANQWLLLAPDALNMKGIL